MDPALALSWKLQWKLPREENKTADERVVMLVTRWFLTHQSQTLVLAHAESCIHSSSLSQNTFCQYWRISGVECQFPQSRDMFLSLVQGSTDQTLDTGMILHPQGRTDQALREIHVTTKPSSTVPHCPLLSYTCQLLKHSCRAGKQMHPIQPSVSQRLPSSAPAP